MTSDILSDFINIMNRKKQLVNGVCVLKDGMKVQEFYWQADEVQAVHSIGKSVLSLAVGIAEEEYDYELNKSLAECFYEYKTNENLSNLENIFITDLLKMNLGVKERQLMRGQREKIETKNWVELALNKIIYSKNEKTFVYSNIGPYLAGIVLQKKMNENLVDYLYPRLFSPLDITVPKWEQDPSGYTFAAGGLYLKLKDVVKIGQLCLQEGEWNGQQLVPKSWIKRATINQITTNSSEPYKQYYGFLFWVGPDRCYRAEGASGQVCFVDPIKKIVIGVTSTKADNNTIVDAIVKTICPFF